MKHVKILLSQSNDVYYNLALEDYLLTQSTENWLVFYINNNAVVIGKHQNPWKEVNLSVAKDFNYRDYYEVARRLSGGGTVYHDKGNINFSFILTKKNDFVNFKEHIIPISNALKALGIENYLTERNDIFIDGCKISGNAEHVNRTKNRILHHGTLLYNSGLDQLNFSIRPSADMGIETHAVSSVRSKVTNIIKTKNLGSVNQALDQLIEQLHTQLLVKEVSPIVPEDIKEVATLVETKYKTPEWIFARTPQFKIVRKDLKLTIRNGKIKTVEGKQEEAFSWLLGLPISRLIQKEPFKGLNKENQAQIEEFIL